MKNPYYITAICICLAVLSHVKFINAQTPNTFRLIVKLKSPITQTETIRSEIGAKIYRQLPLLNMEVWTLPAEYELNHQWLCAQQDFIDHIQSLSPIQYAEPDYTVSTSETPSDTYFMDQWSLNNMGQNGCTEGLDINVMNVWEKTTGSDSVVVGIIDTGIDWHHPDLVDNIWQNLGEDADGDGRTIQWDYTFNRWVFDPDDLNGVDDDDWDNNDTTYVDDLIGWDFVNADNNPMDDNSHGTHVSGIIGASGNNDIGITGINWKVSMMALKALNEQGIGKISDLLDAINYSIAKGVRITNNSWSMQGTYSRCLYEAIKKAKDSTDQLFIAAAGNNGSDNDIHPVYPAGFDLPNIISVAASNCHDERPVFSNFGVNSVDIFAPGDGIFSTLPGGEYGYKSGSSMAAPHVAGAAALMLSGFEGMPYKALRGKILNNSQEVLGLADQCVAGGGLNVGAAFKGEYRFEKGADPWVKVRKRSRWTAIAEQGHYIWGGTDSEGLIRINKYTLEQEVFDSSNSGLPSNIIQMLAASGKDLWIGMQWGLISKFDGEQWITYDLPITSASSILIRKSGSVWATSHRGDLWHFDGLEWKNYNHIIDSTALFQSTSTISLKIFEDSLHNLWIKSPLAISKLNVYDSSWTNIEISNRTVEVDKEGNIWIGTYRDGIYIYSNANNRLTKLTTNSFHLNNNAIIDHIVFGFDNSVWLTTSYPHILYLIKDSIIQDSLVKDNSQLIINSFSNILMDTQGKLWLFPQLMNTPHPNFQTKKDTIWTTNYQDADLPSMGPIRYIYEDPEGNIWNSNQDPYGGLTKYSNGKWSIFTSSVFGNRTPQQIAFDSTGYFWNWTDHDPFLYKCLDTDCDTIDLSSILPSYPDYNYLFNNILVLRDGSILVGTDDGLLLYDEEWKLYDTTNTELPHTRGLKPLLEDHEGNIWVQLIESGYNSQSVYPTYLWVRNEDKWIPFPRFPSGPLQIKDITQIKDSSIWVIGSYKGSSLLKYKDNVWQTYSYPPPYVGEQLAVDHNNQIWIVGDYLGLAKVTETHTVLYTEQNSSIGTNQTRSILLDRNGYLWICLVLQ